MSRVVVPALLTALVLGSSGPALARDKDEAARQKEVEQARKELREAREELKRATADLARATSELEPDSPKARVIEFMRNPRRAMLGVGIAVGPERSGQIQGALITAVTPGSGAEKAGLKSGDILLSANGKSLVAKKGEKPGPERRLLDLAKDLEPGDKVEVEYEREGKTARATVVAQRPEQMDLGAMMGLDEDDLDVMVPRPFPGWSPFDDPEGLQLAKLEGELASYFQTKDGVLVIRTPKDGGLGLKSGDVIQKVDGEPVDTPIEAMDRLRDAGDKDVALDVIRHGKHESLKGKSPVRSMRRSRRIEIHPDDEDR